MSPSRALEPVLTQTTPPGIRVTYITNKITNPGGVCVYYCSTYYKAVRVGRGIVEDVWEGPTKITKPGGV